ncbi:beta-1,3-glucanase family protein [Streptomyces sp. NPDC048362]|uniref:beta-1,3-glucanase family protein n=1 Tax=Streptomyces sp. NPDC048362 TaxID=3365539 RepID=UPI00371DBA43
MRNPTKTAVATVAALLVPLTTGLAAIAYADAPDGPSSSPSATPSEASAEGFPLHIKGGGEYYITIVGQQTSGHYSYVKADGSIVAVTQQPPEGMSFPMNQVRNGNIPLPSHLEGARIFVSKKPMVMPAAAVGGQPSDTGYVQPDLNNPSDPNQGNIYDFFEYTFDRGRVAFGGDTTQVDGFSLPIAAELKQDSSGYDRKVGIAGRKAAALIDQYRRQVAGTPFASLVNADGTHITAPRSASTFQWGGAGSTYFYLAVKKAWEQWTGDGSFKLADGDSVYTGGTGGPGTPLKFKKEVNGQKVASGSVQMPSSSDVAACANTLATGSDTEKFIEAQLCAAFNRGVAQNQTDTWGDTSKYYQQAPFNNYAAFFHDVSYDRHAYGFAYDDVHDQSSVMILPNSDTPTSLTLTIGT